MSRRPPDPAVQAAAGGEEKTVKFPVHSAQAQYVNICLLDNIYCFNRDVFSQAINYSDMLEKNK